MWNLLEIECVKSYKTQENAVKAVMKKLPNIEKSNLRFFIHTTKDGRFFPVFVGQQALQAGIHFHFNVIC